MDAAQQLSGDTKFYGVKMQYEPHEVPPGYASEAINMRFHKGVAETRPGVVFLPWLNKITGGLTGPWGTVYGIGTFRDPNLQIEFTLIAADGAVYYAAPNNAPSSVPLPTGVTITAECRFVQCFDVVLLLRGADNPPLVMTDILLGFAEVAQTDTGDGTLTIPNVLRGVSAVNRLFVVNGDEVWASDELDYTRFSIFNELRINEGSEDRLQNIGFFGRSTLICGKERSIYRVDNVYGDLGAMTLSRVTQRYGVAAPETMVDTGTDFLWLSHEGVASLTLTQQNEVQAAVGALQGKWPMFSDDIKPLIERINWQYAAGAVAAFNDGKYYLAVPLDDAEIIGPELLYFSHGNGANNVVIAVVAGGTYRFTPTANGETLTNGAATLTIPSDFVAAGATVTVNVPAGGFTGATLTRVLKGANNAILVYDTQAGAQGAWAGHDEGGEVDVKRFFVANYLGQRRLFFSDSFGWVKLMDEDVEDQLANPYTDVLVSALPTNGDTLRVNGGTLVTAVGGAANTAAGNWGTGFQVGAAINLWMDPSANGGYAPSATAPWSAPNTQPVVHTTTGVLPDGVRFYGTNGVPPAVVTTGSAWYTITQYTVAPIVATLVTRGYGGPELERQNFRFLTVDLQTWNPSFTGQILSEGVNDTLDLARHGVTTFTKDRTKYYRPFDKAAYNTSNAGNDFATAHRQDYSIVPASSAFAMTPGDGILGNLHQDAREVFSLSAQARSPRLKIVNSTGRIRILAIKLKSTLAPDKAGTTG